MIQRPPRSTRTDTRCPYSTLCRSAARPLRQRVGGGRIGLRLGIVKPPEIARIALHAMGDAVHHRHRLDRPVAGRRSEEHTSELQSLMRLSYAVFCLKKQTTTKISKTET